MPRYDERSGPTRLYVGRLSTRTRSRDLEDLFSKYGRVRDVDLKHDFAFIDFSDPRDADEARHYLNGRSFDGSRIVVEFARRGPRGAGGSREYLGRGPPPGTGRCYNCGHDGHWARDCKAGDWKNKCYRCGQRGHIERNCRSSPRSNGSRSRSRSHTPSEGHHRSRSRSYSRSRSVSRSPKIKGRSPAPERRPRSGSRSLSRTPPRPEVQSRSRSPAVNGQSPNGSPHEDAGRSESRSPVRDVNNHKELRSPARDEHSPSQSGD